jgi:hypothetical protein
MNKRLVLLVAFSTLPTVPAGAQLVSESIDLQEGWNAVWVNVEPEPNTLDEILAAQSPALDYQAIWTFQGNGSIPAITGGGVGQWLLHDRDAPAEISTLQVLHGHRAYLINMRSAGQLELVGRPLIRSTSFASAFPTMFGVATDVASGTLSFEQFFSHPKAIGKVRLSGTPAAHDIFTLIADTYVRKGLVDPIESSKSYWVNVTQNF